MRLAILICFIAACIIAIVLGVLGGLNKLGSSSSAPAHSLGMPAAQGSTYQCSVTNTGNGGCPIVVSLTFPGSINAINVTLFASDLTLFLSSLLSIPGSRITNVAILSGSIIAQFAIQEDEGAMALHAMNAVNMLQAVVQNGDFVLHSNNMNFTANPVCTCFLKTYILLTWLNHYI